MLAGLPNPFEVIRYHSLVVYPETVPDSLEVTARTAKGASGGGGAVSPGVYNDAGRQTAVAELSLPGSAV